MASNNRKAPPRWLPKNADDRNRHAASRAPQMGGSLHAKRRIDNKKIQETLDEMFYKVFDSEIIRSVAHSCGWKLNKSIETLMMLSEDCEGPNAKLADNFGPHSTYKCQLGPNYISKEKASISKSKCAKDSYKFDKNVEKEMCSESLFTGATKRSVQPSKGKSVMMNASQGSIKVMYKGQDDIDISDDDADVVIEEENEFVISELDLPFVDESTRSMYQFLTPFVPQSLRCDGMQYSQVCATRQNSPSVTANTFSVKPGQSPSKLSNKICDKLSDKSPGKKAKHWPKLERIKRLINEGIKVMVLMRGCPGSGKTSLARKIIKSTHGQDEQKYIFSTDHYFIFVGNGKYKFDPRLLPNAHKWNQDRVSEEVKKETNPIIIDNTNLEAWEMQPYVTEAVKYGYSVEFLEPRTSWRNNSFELEQKNTHGVSRKKIEDMLARFERELTPTKLFALYDLKYSLNNVPPQYVSPEKRLLRGEDDSVKHGTKKKLKVKKTEDNSIKSVIHNPVQFCENKIAKQLKVSETLSSDFIDNEIKDSIGKLVSEFNQSIEVETQKEIDFSLENIHNDDDLKMGHGVADECCSNCDDFVGNSSENLLKGKGGEEITEKDFNVFLGLDSEITGDEADFLSDCSESSGDVNVPYDWEGECEYNKGFQCSGGTLFDDIDKTVPLKNCEVEEISGMEYVLVMSDGTLLPQRSYNKGVSSPLKGKGRVWEYLLMTDDDSKPILIPRGNNISENLDTKKNDEVFPDSLECDAPNVDSSADIPKPVVEDSKAFENTFLQKIAAEEPSLEYLLFPNEETEDILGSNNVIENSKNEDDNLVTSVNSSSKGLDFLLAEDVASLNIAFAGVDDALSPGGFPLIHKPDVGSESKEHEPETEKSNCSLQVDIEGTKIVLIKETKYDETLFPQNKDLSDSNELFNFSTPDNKINEVKVEELIDIPASSYVSEFESQIETFVDANVGSDVNATEKINVDVFSSNSFCEDKQNNERSAMEGIIAHPCSLEDSKKKERENNILEEWAEGTSWDDQESSVAKKVILHPDNSPKPARNMKRHISVESNPQKSMGEENKHELNETIAGDSWFAVEEPVATWGLESPLLDKNAEKSSQVIEPQPQRELFALALEDVNNVKEEKMGTKESRKSDDGSCKESAEAICLKSAIDSDDHVNVAENRVFGDQMIAMDSGAENSKEQKSAPFDLCSLGNEFVGASCSTTSESQKPVIHSSTNTHHSDFILLGNVNMGSEEHVPGIKILPTFGRNIVDSVVAGKKQEVRKMGQILMLDKSSMTYDIVSSIPDTENIKEQLRELVSIFPHCCIEDLQEIFERCNRDINWTVDLLLESANQGIKISTPNSSHEVEHEKDLLVESSFTTNNEITECSNFGGTDNASPSAECISSASVHFSSETSVKSLLPSKRNGKKDRTPVSEMSLLLKKQLEENIVINEEHYSEHVSRLRKLRHGEVTDVTEVSGSNQEGAESINDHNHSQSLLDVGLDGLQLEDKNDPGLGASFFLQSEEPEWGVHELIAKDTIEEEEETVAIKVDLNFAEQLHNVFGTASLPFNRDMRPTLNLPLSLARQLHYYMMEAEQNTYDLMTQEDEEFARNLQVQEDQASAEALVSSAKQVPDLREIMDMEMALALYKTDQKQNNPETKEDLATKLTKNLLCEWFPSLPKDVLVNVFEAHNHSFEETLEVLLASTEEDNSVRIVMSPEARAAHEKALLEKANLEGVKSKEYVRPYSMESNEVTQEQALLDANYFRSEASRHYDLRNECQRKAQSAYQRGLTAAASYYSQMASLHKERIEENNARAASSLLLAHSLGNLSTTLDLHFLYVVEALQVLDMFLDHHIQQLLETSHRSVTVFVITGRGARSSGGRSRIKPAVVQRLDQRGLRHEEVNPGLLKVVITRNATCSTRISD